MPSSRTPPDEFSDSDQQWFDRLSGKPVAEKDASAVREADALRLALERERHRLAGDTAGGAEDEAVARDWERLQSTLDRQGLLHPRRRSPWTWPAVGGLAAALVLSAVLVPLWTGLGSAVYPEPPVLRGGPPVRQVATANARRSAESFAQALQQAGLAPVLYQQDKNFLVDIPLLSDQLEAATPAFMRHGLTPSTGLNRVIFSGK